MQLEQRPEYGMAVRTLPEYLFLGRWPAQRLRPRPCIEHPEAIEQVREPFTIEHVVDVAIGLASIEPIDQTPFDIRPMRLQSGEQIGVDRDAIVFDGASATM